MHVIEETVAEILAATSPESQEITAPPPGPILRIKPKKIRKIVRTIKKIRGQTTDERTRGGKEATQEGKPLKFVLCDPFFSDELRKRYRRLARASRLAGGVENYSQNRLFRTHKLGTRHLYDAKDVQVCFAICRSDEILAKALAKMLAARANGKAAKVAKVATPANAEAKTE
jgi:hypothetical protein